MSSMRGRARTVLFWTLTAFLLLLALVAVTYAPMEPGWVGQPGLKLVP